MCIYTCANFHALISFTSLSVYIYMNVYTYVHTHTLRAGATCSQAERLYTADLNSSRFLQPGRHVPLGFGIWGLGIFI